MKTWIDHPANGADAIIDPDTSLLIDGHSYYLGRFGEPEPEEQVQPVLLPKYAVYVFDNLTNTTTVLFRESLESQCKEFLENLRQADRKCFDTYDATFSGDTYYVRTAKASYLYWYEKVG